MSFRVIGIGEALWDLFPSGKQLGGAPANFAYHAKMLGASAKVVTRVGNDSLGKEILRRFDEMGIADDVVQVDDHAPTGTANVLLKSLGVPTFVINENVAWDRLELTEAALKAVQVADAVCFGSLAQRRNSSASIIQRLVAAAPIESLKVFDINLRQDYYTKDVIESSLALANVLKLNDQELPVLAKMFGLQEPERRLIELLAARYDFEAVALTRGNKGSLFYRGGLWSDLPGSSVRIVDTVGAGDSFTAALVMGLLCGMSLHETHQAAAEMADYVCTCQGATPAMPGHFRDKFNSQASRRLTRTSASMAIE